MRFYSDFNKEVPADLVARLANIDARCHQVTASSHAGRLDDMHSNGIDMDSGSTNIMDSDEGCDDECDEGEGSDDDSGSEEEVDMGENGRGTGAPQVNID